MDYFSFTEKKLQPEEGRVRPWFAVNGDQTLRIDYPLSSKSIVYDVGGYKGEWAENIYKKFGCNVEVFEPVQKFIDIIDKKFADNKKVTVHKFGLAGSSREESINLDQASTSTFSYKSGKRREKIRLEDAAKFIKNHHERIDLIKINIEGGEYELLQRLIDTDLIKTIDNAQVQFHVFVPGAERKRAILQGKLSKTHELTYSYPWIWENWRRKK